MKMDPTLIWGLLWLCILLGIIFPILAGLVDRSSKVAPSVPPTPIADNDELDWASNGQNCLGYRRGTMEQLFVITIDRLGHCRFTSGAEELRAPTFTSLFSAQRAAEQYMRKDK